jgi:hypothetical protein
MFGNNGTPYREESPMARLGLMFDAVSSEQRQFCVMAASPPVIQISIAARKEGLGDSR